MPVKAKLLSVESGAVRPLESVTCRWNPGEPNGRKGHEAGIDLELMIVRKGRRGRIR